MAKLPKRLADKSALYESYYRYQRNVERMPFRTFSQAVDLLASRRHTRAKAARRVGIPETRMRRLGIFLRTSIGNPGYRARAESLRLSQKFPDAVERYMRLRTEGRLSNFRAAKIVGVNRYTALDWERALLSEEQRRQIERDMKSNLNADPKRNEMRLLLGVKNQDGTFRFPPKAIMDALVVKIDAIRTANADNPRIRGKHDVDEVAKRFIGGSRVKIPALAEEARQILPKLLAEQEMFTAWKQMKELLSLPQGKRIILEARIMAALDRNGCSATQFAGRKEIIRIVLAFPKFEVPIRDILYSPRVPEIVRRNLVAEVNSTKTADGTRLLVLGDGILKLSPSVVKFV